MKLNATWNSQAALVILFLALIIPADGATIARIGTQELANRSELIFEGVVILVQSEVAQNQRIYTYVDFLMEDVLVGNGSAGDIITLRFTGGSVDGETLDVGVRVPDLDERGIYFVEQVSPGLINPLLGWEQGHFIVNGSGAVVAGNSLSVEKVELQSSSGSSQISAGVAYGISTLLKSESGAELATPMSATEFKQKILELVE